MSKAGSKQIQSIDLDHFETAIAKIFKSSKTDFSRYIKAPSRDRVVSVDEYVSAYHKWVYKNQEIMDTAPGQRVGLNFDG